MTRTTGVRAVALLLAVIVPALVSLSWPLGPDQAILMTVAQTWLHGSAPYVGAIDTKGPFAYVPFLVASLPGDQFALALRVLDLTIITAACAWLYRELRHVVGPSAAWWSAAVLAAMFVRIGYQDASQPDGWVALCAAPLLVRAFRAEPIGVRNAILVGVLAGLSALVKPFYLVLLAAPALILLLRHSAASSARFSRVVIDAPWRAMVTVSAWAVLGFVVVVVPMLLVLALQGALDDMFRVYLGPFVSAYYAFSAKMSAADFMRGLLSFYVLRPFGLALSGIALVGWALMRRAHGRFAWFTLFWFVVALALVVLQRRFFAYHWLVTLPPVCILAGFGLSGLGDRAAAGSVRSWRSWRALGIASSFALLLLLVSRPARDVLAAVRASAATDRSVLRSLTLQSPRAGLSAGAERTLRMRDSMIARGLRDKGVATWMYDPGPVLLAGAHAITAIIAISPSYLGADDFAKRTLQDMGDRLASVKPQYVLIDCWLSWDSGGTADPAKASTFSEEIARWYSLAVDVDGLRLFQRQPAANGASSAAVGAGPERASAASRLCAQATASAGSA